MKLLKRLLIISAIIFAATLIAGFFYLRHLGNRSIPDYNRDVILKNMTASVTVYRDGHGVPHIYAENEADLYRATGYVMAQDRLWQIDLIRRATMGRLSEIFGKELLNTDMLMRSLRITEKSRLMLSKLDPPVMALMESFADGVNQYIETHKSSLPPEFAILDYEPEAWEPVHSGNLVGYMAWDLSFAWGAEVLLHRISQKIDAERFKLLMPDLGRQPAVHPDFALIPGQVPELALRAGLLEDSQKLVDLGLVVFDGSNNWAVSGKKSVTGKPVFANDMHLGLFAPGIWYQMHQVVKGQLDVTGVALPGQPFVVAGHNSHIAWGMTNVMVDDLDFYLETVNPDNPNQYRFNGQWRDMTVSKQTVKIKGGEPVEKELRFTHRGPVVTGFHELEDMEISARWIGNEYSNEIRTIYLLNRAQNWEQFRNAVKTFIAISQNIIYADIEGNIGLQTSAGVPIRKGNGFAIVPGDTGEYDWTGLVPFEKLPYTYNPESGHVSSANNKTADNDYPYHISHWFATGERIVRIREMLEEKEKFSVEDFRRMHGDFKSSHVKRFLPDILGILNQANDLDPLEAHSRELLSGWDGVLTENSTAASVFEKMYVVMARNLVKDELGPELTNRYIGNKILLRNLIINVWKNKDSQWCDNADTDEKESFNDWILDSFRAAVFQLKTEMGSDPVQWQWGKLHKLILRHPLGRVKLLDTLFDLNRGPYPVGGSFHTVCPYNYSLRVPFLSNYGPSHRHVYDTADWDNSFSVIPTGTSGIPASPFYCDQTPLYISNRYHNDYVSKEKVVTNAKFKMTFLKK